MVKFKKDSNANFVAQVHYKNTAKMRKLYYAKFSLASDKPHLMVPRNKHMVLHDDESTIIDVDIKPQKREGRAQCHLFVQCEELYVHEVIAIDI